MTTKIPPEGKTKNVNDLIAECYEPSALPIGSDGGIAPGSFPVDTRPLGDFDAGVCVRGPCRHLWKIINPFEAASSPKDYAELGHNAPIQITRTCCAHPGTETSLSGDLPILECNRWDPYTPLETAALAARQHEWEIDNARVSANPSGRDAVEEASGEDAAGQHDEVPHQ